mmetsp:Transcript_19958/g.70603  ORF Transcript_19958/g.70603 Transcript_19958/m.70603 type:complete len:448 (-) Transcript_19958:260-1603(-)
MSASGGAGGGGAAAAPVVKGGAGHEVEGEAATSDVAALLASHRGDIDALRAAVADAPELAGGRTHEEGSWCKYDDHFYLRYILSFGTAAAAERACREAVAIRATPEHRDRARRVQTATWIDDSALAQQLLRYETAGFIKDGLRDGGVLFVARAALGDPFGHLRHMSAHELMSVYLDFREWAWMMCDRTARETGRLVKLVTIVDMAGATMSQVNNPKVSKIHADVSELSGVLFPQLLGKMVLANSPGWMAMMFAFLSKIMPRRFTDKVVIFASPEALFRSAWGASALNRAALPAFLGGGVPDDALPPELTGALLAADASEGLTTLTVAARSREAVRVTVPLAGSTVRFSVSVMHYGVNVRAVLHHGEGDGVEAAERLTGATTTLRGSAGGSVDKVKSETGADKAVWACPRAGVLEVEFDNSYSLLRSKTLDYSIAVVAPVGAGEGAEG